MTVVVGTAGHIDHGKTTLLRALTGIDADRLPEEKRRGLTIDVGYAHGTPDGGPEIDYVDVPGHDRLVGNMLVGAGEVDACLLVVAADDGPRAQTWEHLGLLDAMGIEAGLVAVTKCDLAGPERAAEVEGTLRTALAGTRLAGVPIIVVSATTGEGLVTLRRALAGLRDEVSGRLDGARWPGAWLAIDRAFSIRGRGLVVTGSSRGEPIARGQDLHVVPGRERVRVRAVQVHDMEVATGPRGGRVALNLAGAPRSGLRRGQVLAGAASRSHPLAARATERLLVALEAPAALPGRRGDERWPPRDGAAVRVHLDTDQVDAVVGRSGRDGTELEDGRAIGVLRLARPVAAAPGQRLVLRHPAPAGLLAGGVVLDADPPRGRSRRRQSAASLERLDGAIDARREGVIAEALANLHGCLVIGGVPRLAEDVRSDAGELAVDVVRAHHATHTGEGGIGVAALRARVTARLRALLSVTRADAETATTTVLDGLFTSGALVREREAVHMPGFLAAAPDPERAAAMERLVELLDTSTPPPLGEAARRSGCPTDAVGELERQGRIVVVDDELAWSAPAWDRLRALALELAARAPLTPAALRDASGTSRKYVMALLEDLDRRGILTRTPAGHVPGPRA